MTTAVKLPWHLGREVTRRRSAHRAAQGAPSRVPSSRVQQHVKELRAVGVSRGMISAASGVSVQALTFIEDGTFEWTLVDRADAILKVTVHPLPCQSWVVSVGALRRMEALRALGFTVPNIADRLGVSRTRVLDMWGRPACTYRRWAGIRDLYDELSITPVGELQGSPHGRARALAMRSGFILPMEWEGYDIDDPRVVPPRAVRKSGDMAATREVDEVLVQRIVDGRHEGVPPKLERDAAFRRLDEAGWSATRIAERLHVTPRTVERLRAAA